ncbi:hypothetical protein MCOR02_003799 [Pyricularia oryzae]|uniref:Mitochondrial import inner membrane translocase subunit TIM54 n=1 Tax=Pyricularia oryzae TaxID=318829 RepID=A0A4P7MXZ4_PYROR|nr:hypothetical protein MCOR02_003799 [Pyricularia oryzae]KAI6270525.1 hypothetical protein MCOR26_008188 [Pyricularia oryzae]KAI6310749.1 hypothetical protein MCOR34_006268 [Pyricularia oryzae]KAI6336865.1 hypothetical protein MCOR30_003549 [Pyricularia oryzae]KAI6340550.1 hypothetical protein MCOR28_006526 [Pyricularia oryzae]
MASTQKPPERNRALRMLGLPALPKKLPSRNWMIFWTVSTTLSAAIIYDRREKRRATARWARAVSHLAKEPVGSPSEMPRRLTVYLESPPGDGFRVAQDHFVEYVKPILAASGLDWEFVQGRMQGDVRAVVAEQIRRRRRAAGEVASETPEGLTEQKSEPTTEEIVEEMRKKSGVREFAGVRGDIVVGRHTWKEYIRGLHEGWLGPLVAPSEPPKPVAAGAEEAKEAEEKKSDESKPKRPPQPKPYNTPEQYPSSEISQHIPAELTPSVPIRFPHLLGFLGTPTRFVRFLNRRQTADEIGAEVAAVCLATYREWKSEDEIKESLESAEKDWVKSVWKADKTEEGDVQQRPKEKVWVNPVVLDPRISSRMRRFELTSADETRARQIVVPEEEVEGWIKGHLRQMWRWGAGQFRSNGKKIPNVGPLDD